MDRYEEALERAKKGLPIDEVFPELKESEDERIRKWLADYFKAVGKSWIHRDISPEQILAYLEKQKEQKPAESDAIKGGDFISDGKRVFLVLANVKERNLGETGSTFCEGHILGVDGVVYCDGDNFKKFKRATSDERAKFIHDLKVGVELKEQLAEWSEEDERKRQACISTINEVIDYERERWEDYNPGKPYRPIMKYDEQIDWLKSLRPQPHWKPSEEQIRTLDIVISDYRHACTKDSDKKAETLKPLLEQLEKL